MKNWGFTLNDVTANWSENDNTILEKFNFEFHIHDAYTAALPLMGPSGQGKSTLLYLLAALKLPSEGTVTWRFPNDTQKTYSFSKDTADQKNMPDIIKLRRDYFGFAFQSSTLSEYLTVKENIAYPLLLQGKSWNEASDTAEARFNQMMVDEKEEKKQRLLNAFPSQLSGGERQRAALVQAIIHDPYVLFADEPTGQLDLYTRKQVMKVLQQWLVKGDGQRCLIWVTHHHINDLKMMGVKNLLFIENKTGISRDHQWLENWVNQISENNNDSVAKISMA